MWDCSQDAVSRRLGAGLSRVRCASFFRRLCRSRALRRWGAISLVPVLPGPTAGCLPRGVPAVRERLVGYRRLPLGSTECLRVPPSASRRTWLHSGATPRADRSLLGVRSSPWLAARPAGRSGDSGDPRRREARNGWAWGSFTLADAAPTHWELVASTLHSETRAENRTRPCIAGSPQSPLQCIGAKRVLTDSTHRVHASPSARASSHVPSGCRWRHCGTHRNAPRAAPQPR